MATFQELSQDSEFLALDPVSKRQVLDASDSSFASLDEISKVQVIGTLEDPIPIVTQAPQDLRREALAAALTRQEQRPGLTQALEALIAPGRAGAGIAEGLYNLIVKGAQGAGTVLGGEAPIGDTAQTALEVIPRATFDLGAAIRAASQDPKALNAIMNPVQAALMELTEGSRTPSQAEIQRAFENQQEQQQIAQFGEQPIVPEIFGTSNIDVARAAPLVTGIGGTARALPAIARELPAIGSRIVSPVSETLSTIRSRGIFSKPLEDAITRSTGITASEGSLETATVAKTRISEWPGKPPKTAQEAVEVANKAQTSVLQDALVPLRAAEREGLVMKGDSMIVKGREAVARDFPSLANDTEAINGILNEFSYLRGDLAPTRGQGFLRELNRRYNGLENKNSPEASAYRAIRNELSSQTDDIIKAQTGRDISPYREWGQLEEFKEGVRGQISSAQRTQGGREGAESAGRIPTTTRGAIGETVRQLPVSRALVPRAIESVDKGIRRIFKEVKSLPKSADLGEDAVNALRLKYQPRATPPELPATVSPDLQALRRSSIYREATPEGKAALERSITSLP